MHFRTDLSGFLQFTASISFRMTYCSDHFPDYFSPYIRSWLFLPLDISIVCFDLDACLRVLLTQLSANVRFLTLSVFRNYFQSSILTYFLLNARSMNLKWLDRDIVPEKRPSKQG